ncbi:hypothetical protein DPSP01_010175 [Paraphaeosphaeria sporulosa]|uniref:Killer toxin n=1 Tax=Paraphaeosphaeria sporulosa TaxID=1460663 RepID=A0A177D0Y0_9PLEO|nr:killer toxin [Paraphaeosphaeria sporulosa]OAG12659.1 killer toxin [Paraphaeosphaeria sporulosa]
MKVLIILAALLGISIQLDINCRGSAMCSGCKQPLGDGGMLDFINDNLSDDAVFKDGQQVACKSCHLTKNEGLCVFPQKLGDKTVTGKDVKRAVQRLKEKGCKYCGSAPLGDSHNVGDGEITVNYITNGCIKHGNKIC